MAYVKIEVHKRSIVSRKESINNWTIPDEEKNAIYKFLNELALGRVNKGVRISEARQSKYLDGLKTVLPFFNKVSTELTLTDIENFEI